MKRLFPILAVALLAGACGSSSPTTAPTPQIPNVAGSYSGSTTFLIIDTGERLICPTVTTITQAGASVSVAPLILGGACGNLSIPMGSQSIDATGSLGNLTTSTTTSCGAYSESISGGFFGRQLQMSLALSALTRGCPSINMTIALSH